MTGIKMFIKHNRYAAIALLGLFALRVPHAISQYRPSAAVQSITIEELREHVFFLASDSLRGRVTGTIGYQIAAKYADREFRAADLQTVLKDAQGNATYLQGVPFMRRDPGDKGELVF